MGKQIAAVEIKFFKNEMPIIKLSDGVVKLPAELFSKTLNEVMAEKQRLQVKLSNRARREQRLKEQEEMANASS